MLRRLLIAEASTRRVQALAASDPDMLVWWGSAVECVSALARLERSAALDARATLLAFDRLKQLAAGWHEIEPSDIVRETGDTVHSSTSAASCRCGAARSSLRRRRTTAGLVDGYRPRRSSCQRRAEGRIWRDR